MEDTTLAVLKYFNKLDIENKKQVAFIIICNLNIELIEKTPTLYAIAKSVFREYIENVHNDGCVIKKYEEIFKESLGEFSMPIVDEEWRQKQLELFYNYEKSKELVGKKFKYAQHKLDDLVGARKNGELYLATIKWVAEFNGRYVYYVKWFNMPDSMNEFVDEKFVEAYRYGMKLFI